MLKREKFFIMLMISVFMALPHAFASYASNAADAGYPSEEQETDQTEETPEVQEETEAALQEASAPDGRKWVSLGIFRTTAYCPCRSCSEGYGRCTSTGATARANHTIAVDPRVIPYGSQIMINGIVYTAEDCGGGVKGNHIDIFYDTHAQTRQHGIRREEVFLLV